MSSDGGQCYTSHALFSVCHPNSDPNTNPNPNSNNNPRPQMENSDGHM